ncbi:MAG: putative Ig domain-containing protein, partial [Vicinamibacterales bacterium]
GNDVYLYARGDGRDEIAEFDETPGNIDTLRFDPAIAPQDVRVTREYGSAILVLGDGADRVALIGTLDDPANEIERIEFGDGTVWSSSDLAARVELLPATALGDILWGTEAEEAIAGLAGDDAIYGNGGDDFLDGGADSDYVEGGDGSDILAGGDGDDSLADWGEGNNLILGGAGDDYAYHEGHSIVIGGAGNDWIDNRGPDAIIAFNAGDGEDTIYAAESFVLSLGGGIGPADLELSQKGEDLILSMGAAGAIRLIRPFEEEWPAIALQMFGSVHTYDFNAVLDQFYAAPDLVLPLGEVLPAHQTSFSETAGFGGAIAWNYATGDLDALTLAQIQSVLSDPQFGAAPQPISLDSENHAPTTEDDNADVLEDGIVSASGNVLANDSDADADTTLLVAAPGTYVGTFGTLSLDEEGVYEYVLDNAAVQFLGDEETATDTFVYQATDGTGQTAGTLAVTVFGANDAPVQVTALPDRGGREGQAFLFTVPSDTFSDADSGDSLTLSAAPLPGWLSFEDGAFSGTPGLADGGEYPIVVTATDSAGASTAASFNLTVTDSLATGNHLTG